jgi:hypothetical protein
MKKTQGLSTRKPEGKYHLRIPGVKEDNIKGLQTLNKCSREVWSGFSWL